jgi:thiol-disulfide isomerase/thioredoxin
MKANQLLLAAIFASAIGAPIETLAADKSVAQQVMPAAVQLPVEGEFPSLGGATEWLNSQPLTAAGLRGKVVLIDVWTYTCINWLRSLPYVRAWAEKYKNQGLVVIGVHAPEFAFEKNIDNVRRAAKDMKVNYPIAIDNNYAIWRALKNEYWPALYFVDAQGKFAIIILARASTNSRKGSFNNYCPRLACAASVKNWFRSMPAVRKLPPIGTA